MRRIIPATASCLALAAAVLATAAAPASADDRTCTATIGAETIDGNVVVPAGAACTLDGTVVEGNVLVGPGAELTATGADIDGNVQDDDNDAGAVSLADTRVGGNVQLFDGDRATIRGNDIDGELQYEDNTGPLVAESNAIGGNLQANQNTGGLTITGNTIDGNLQCAANTPAPTGGGNTVGGDAEDQCADLEDASQNGAFVDVDAGSTHAAVIDWLVAAGITEGCSADGSRFCPTRAVTRAQMATFLDRALGLPAGTATFADVAPSSTHADAIAAAADAGITTGCSADGADFCPDLPVNRAQMASFLDRALGLPAGTATFADVAPSSTHAGAIAAIADAGITTGCDADGSRYCPTRPVTRAQMASFLQRALAG